MPPLPSDSEVVVTGGAGFIGSNVVAGLNARGHTNITIVDRLGTGEKWKNLRGLAFRDCMGVDAFSGRMLAGAAPPPAAIIHMGACSATTETNADYLLENNYRYTRRVCEYALRNGCRLILASSAATYGDGGRGYSDDPGRAHELTPLNMYGMSKHMLDEWAIREGHYARMVGLKFFNVYGPREAHKGDMRSVVHKAYHEVLRTGAISLFRSDRPDYADGMQKRDFVFVGDAVGMILWFLDRPDRNGLYNCGTGTARTWLDLAHAVFAAMGRDGRINWIDLPPHLSGKYQYFTEADLTRLRAVGYDRAFTPLEDGVRQYASWLMAGNP